MLWKQFQLKWKHLSIRTSLNDKTDKNPCAHGIYTLVQEKANNNQRLSKYSVPDSVSALRKYRAQRGLWVLGEGSTQFFMNVSGWHHWNVIYGPNYIWISSTGGSNFVLAFYLFHFFLDWISSLLSLVQHSHPPPAPSPNRHRLSIPTWLFLLSRPHVYA